MKSIILLFPMSLFLLACATGAPSSSSPTGSLDSRLQP